MLSPTFRVKIAISINRRRIILKENPYIVSVRSMFKYANDVLMTYNVSWKFVSGTDDYSETKCCRCSWDTYITETADGKFDDIASSDLGS